MDDPRHTFIAAAKLNETLVLGFDGFIFLCGGKIDAKSEPPASVREALLRQFARHRHLDDRLRLAESIGDWYFDGHYTDLLEFEDHMAQLSAAIVLVLESEGSLAELGIFSSFDHFRDKLIVVMSTHHYNQKSFVRLGPIKFLEDNLDNQSECFPWISTELGNPRYDGAAVDKLQVEMFESIRDRIKILSGDEQFDRSKWLHSSLLICDLISLFGALTVGEVKEFLRELGLDRTQGQLRKTLFMLERIGMLCVVARSSQRFYVSLVKRDLVRWRLAGGILDREKVAYSVLSFYEKSDKRRFRAIQDARSA